MKKGIDISKWQGSINFGEVKREGIEFVILREGYGLKTTDKKFLKYVKDCREVNMPIHGVYHFSYALTEEEVKKEAELCIRNVEKAGLNKDTIVFFDLEYSTINYAKQKGITIDKTKCTNHTVVFCEEVKRLGYIPGVYFNMDYYRNMYDFKLIEEYVIWLADWTGEPDIECSYHQYTSSGHVSGIYGDVDMTNYLGEKKITLIKTLDEIVIEVMDGKWGNGDEREALLTKTGYKYIEIQYYINQIDRIGVEVVEGKWGNGEERKTLLTEAGHNYKVIQHWVNYIVAAK